MRHTLDVLRGFQVTIRNGVASAGGTDWEKRVVYKWANHRGPGRGRLPTVVGKDEARAEPRSGHQGEPALRPLGSKRTRPVWCFFSKPMKTF